MTDVSRRLLVAVTRDERPDDRFTQELERRGLEPLHLPTIRIVAPTNIQPLEAALVDVSRFDWVVFTSAHAVEAICQRPERLNAFRHATSRPRVAAVGGATANRLAAAGITVDLTPSVPDGGGTLAAALVKAGRMDGTYVLWPRSEIAQPELADSLRRHGAVVVDPAAYNTVPDVPAALPQFLDGLDGGRIGATAFLSPSSARGLAAALDGTLRRLPGRTLLASLGPTTTRAVIELGATVDIEAEARRSQALAAAIAERLSARRGDAA